MTESKLFNFIGAFIFGGMGLMVFLQLDQAYKMIEAGIFIAVMAIIYFLGVLIYRKNRGIFVPYIAVLALLAVGMIFLQGLIFGAGH